MESGNEDMFLGGYHAHQLREKLQMMDRELSTPSRSLTKRPCAAVDSDDSDSSSKTKRPREALDSDDSDANSESDMQQSRSQGDVMSPTDKKKCERVSAFVSKSCGCTLGPSKKPCSKQLTTEKIQRCRNDSLEMTRAKLDLVINPWRACAARVTVVVL